MWGLVTPVLGYRAVNLFSGEDAQAHEGSGALSFVDRSGLGTDVGS